MYGGHQSHTHEMQHFTFTIQNFNFKNFIMNRTIQDMRLVYNSSTLLESNIPSNPFTLFKQWFDHAVETLPAEREPNAVCLSTCSIKARPSSRMVLLKNYNEDGFVIYTNYNSRKGQELS